MRFHPLLCFIAASASLLLVATPARACGACAEDKMAATYDHAVVQQAAAQRKVVVFCDVQGVVAATARREAAARAAGVQAGSVRVSAEPAAVSFLLDPSVQQPQAAAAEVARLLGDQKVRIVVLRTMAGPA